jgi:hypothetical protein
MSKMMTTEFCYKLNIPPFIDIVRDDWKKNLDFEKFRKWPTVSPGNLVIQEQYLNFNNIEWKNIVCLPLDAHIVSYIHSDNDSDSIDPNLENPKYIWFGINFVISGTGRMDYYLPSQLDPDSFFDPTDTYQQKNWTTKQQPHKSYELTPGAYLVNTTVPHRGSAYEKRMVMSLRPNYMGNQGGKFWGKSWEYIVKMFDNYIIK